MNKYYRLPPRLPRPSFWMNWTASYYSRHWNNCQSTIARSCCFAKSKKCRIREISATLAIPTGTVMSRLSRARRALKNTAQGMQRS